MTGHIPGSRKPIEGAPYAQWPVMFRSPHPKMKARTVWYPEDADEGTAHAFIARVLIPVEGEQRIYVQMARGTDHYDRNQIEKKIRWARDHTDMSEFKRREAITETGIAKVTSALPSLWQTGFDVKRCGLRGCRSFGGWHHAGGYDRQHVADVIETGKHRVSIVHDGREWRIRVSTPSEAQTAREAQQLADDLAWMLAELQKLNARQEVIA